MNKYVIPEHKPFYYLDPKYQNFKVVITLGSRGLGKTCHFKLRGIEHFLNTGRCFLYLRRFKEEINDAKRNFLKDIYEGWEDLKAYEWKFEGNKLLCNGKVCGYFYALSTTLTKKSIVFNDVDILIYDEFLTLGYTIRGGNEITIFLEWLETLFRTRSGIQIFLLSNAISTTSQYFEIFGFDKPLNPNRRYQSPKGKENLVVCEIHNSQNWKEYKEKTELYSVLGCDEYKRYSIENEFIFESTENIKPRKDIRGHLVPAFNVICENITLTAYKYDHINYYLDEYHPNTELTYTFIKELAIKGGLFISSSSSLCSVLTYSITNKRIFYSDMKVKKAFLENIKEIITTFY